MKLTNGIDLSNFKIMPERVLVRFSHKDYDDVFLGREIETVDGRKIRLTIKKDYAPDMDAKSTVFRRLAEVLQVGRKVEGIEVGDIAIMDYKVDNDATIVVGEDEIGKIVACNGVSKYFEKNKWRYANRLNPRDMLMEEEGQLESVSDILGVIRNGKLLAKDPYVFLKYKAAKEMKVSQFGIIYEEAKRRDEYEVISSSLRSKRKYNIIEGCKVLIDEIDTFHVEIKSGDSILVCNDSDVKLTKNSFKDLNIKTPEDFIKVLK